MKTVHKSSVIPIYGIGVVWLAFGFLAPLHSVQRFLLCAVASFGAYLLLKLIFPGKDVQVETKEPEPDTGDAELDAILKSGRESVRQIRQLNDKITAPRLSAQLNELESVTAKIFSYLEEQPARKEQLRTFLSYYLPTTIKLLQTYVQLQEQGVEGENIRASMRKIESILETVLDAFRKQLDALFASTAVDVTADIQVLEQMMAAQGLTEDGKIDYR